MRFNDCVKKNLFIQPVLIESKTKFFFFDYLLLTKWRIEKEHNVECRLLSTKSVLNENVFVFEAFLFQSLKCQVLNKVIGDLWTIQRLKLNNDKLFVFDQIKETWALAQDVQCFRIKLIWIGRLGYFYRFMGISSLTSWTMPTFTMATDFFFYLLFIFCCLEPSLCFIYQYAVYSDICSRLAFC